MYEFIRCFVQIERKPVYIIIKMNDVYILIDCSWSMREIKDIVINDINNYIAKKPKSTRFSVYFFNHHIDRPIIRKQCIYITNEMYEIWGRSGLYDAIDITLRDADHRSVGPCTVMVYTDGKDTASIYCSHDHIQKMIEQFETEKGYTFEFLYRNPFKKRKLETSFLYRLANACNFSGCCMGRS